MTGLLTELGKKIADRWLTALILPGLLFVAATVCAHLLGWRHALDPACLAAGLNRAGTALAGKPAPIAVAVVAALLAATGAGLGAHAMAAAVHRVYIARGPRRLLRRLMRTHRRTRPGHPQAQPAARWPVTALHGWSGWCLARLLTRRRQAQTRALRRHPPPPKRYLPARATVIGDRFRLTGERVNAQYGLDATAVWPRLWLLLPDAARGTVQAAHSQYQAAVTLTAWGVLYLALGTAWPPALLAGTITVVTGYRRAVTAAAVLADLIEAAIDTHQPEIAGIAGIALPHGRITPTDGIQINDLLNKRA